mmetsp:Transcript_3110/g.5472  ORF Transcript_3110/g.5472 Transcript_3110/m.5472 type:complete len:779 (-) Transcript_3110:1060-3396(-)
MWAYISIHAGNNRTLVSSSPSSSIHNNHNQNTNTTTNVCVIPTVKNLHMNYDQFSKQYSNNRRQRSSLSSSMFSGPLNTFSSKQRVFNRHHQFAKSSSVILCSTSPYISSSSASNSNNKRNKQYQQASSTPIVVSKKSVDSNVDSVQSNAVVKSPALAEPMTGDGDPRNSVDQKPELLLMEQSWEKKASLSAWRRSLEIWVFFFRFLFKELKLRKKSKEEKSITRLTIARQLKQGLLSLGPTFIKLGQLLSTRVDIVPKEYIDELSELQDRVPGFPAERARKIIEKELNVRVDDVFQSFENAPVAAASLGQVHRAQINGKKVVVKVQREGLKELFDTDLKNLKLLAVILSRIDPQTDGADRDWVGIYDESAKLLYEEIDYGREAENANRFSRNFSSIDWIKVPEVYSEYSSSKILTLEYVPGVKISDKAGILKLGLDPSKLAQRSGESYLSQLFRHGYLHCDPHGGNLAVDANAEGGRLIYYDFGMMAEIKPEVKRGLVELIFGVYDGSSREVCDALEKMGVLRKNVDRVSVEKVAKFFLETFRFNASDDLAKLPDAERKEATKKIMQSRLSTIGSDLLSLTDDAPFKFPATFTFVFRAFTTLEGIGKSLDSSYDLTRIARPYLKELIDLKDGSATLSAVKSVQKRLGWRAEDIESVVTQPRRIAYVANTLRKMEEGELKLRVRVLESEQSFKRMTIVLEAMGAALFASILLNAALVMSSTSMTMSAVLVSSTGAASQSVALSRYAKLLWTATLIAALNVLKCLVQLKSLDKKLARYN